MHKLLKIVATLALVLVAACVTVNIYFPAAELQKDAERVVKQAYGIEEQKAPEEGSSLSPGLLDILGPATAHAQNYVELSNATTRGLEQQVVATTKQLAPYFSSGNVGLDNSGFAVLRDKGGLDMKQLGQVNRLVASDHKFKAELYKEKAKAAGTPGKVGDVQSIYANLWKQYAASGTWIQSGGSWAQK